MKRLEEVVKKRDKLKETLEILEYERQNISAPHKGIFSAMNEEEKKEYSRIITAIMKLKVQIDALTYVINYDSELQDVTKPPKWSHTWFLNILEEIRMSNKKTCYRCGGAGYTNRTVVIGTLVTVIQDHCSACSGTGKVD